MLIGHNVPSFDVHSVKEKYMSKQSVILVNHAGTDKLIADVARVSFANHNFDPLLDPTTGDLGLIKYLARGLRTKEFDALLNRIEAANTREEAFLIYDSIRHISTHFTPFTHTSITIQCTAPVPIRTQLFKHTIGLTANEESRRYIVDTPELYIPDVLRCKAEDVKQGSAGVHPKSDDWLERYVSHCQEAIHLYEQMIADGVCPEQARFILPQGVKVTWVWTGNLFAFANVFNKRIDPHAQKEVQDFAANLADVIEPLFPASWDALTRKTY